MKRILVAGAVLAAMTASWVFASEAATFPADVDWAARLDAKRLLDGSWGPMIRAGALVPDAAAKLNAAKVLLGVDLLNDITSAAICGTGPDKVHVVVYVTGTFDHERLLALAAVAQGHEVLSHGAYEVHAWNDRAVADGKAYAAFARPDMLVFAFRAERIREALDALDGRGRPARTDLVAALDSPAGFLSAAAMDLKRIPAANAQTAILEHIDRLQLSLGVEGDRLRLTLTAVAEDAETAARVRDVLVGLQALLRLDAGRHQAAAALAARAEIRQVGLAVHLTLTATEDELKQLDQRTAANRPVKW